MTPKIGAEAGVSGALGGGVPAEEVQRLSSWPREVARSDLAAHFAFSLEDLRASQPPRRWR
ncbi:MAG: hypothetical protein ACLP8S_06695 [Solirubrobacteraceae bacterium]